MSELRRGGKNGLGTIWSRNGKRQAHSDWMKRVPYVILYDITRINCRFQRNERKVVLPVGNANAEHDVPFL